MQDKPGHAGYIERYEHVSAPSSARLDRRHRGPARRGRISRRPLARHGALPGASRWAGRCSSKAKPASARPRSPRCSSATLGRRLIRLQCYEGLDVAAAVYEWNYAAQMIAIRLAEAAGEHDRDAARRDVFSERFLIKRPLLQALEPDTAGAPVLLIDELDRTDEAFEAFLLEVLADFQVTIPEIGTVKAAQPPIVVITSNRTREIHDALKRRCLYHWVGYPNAERELAIVRAKVPGVGKKLSRAGRRASCRRCASRISSSRRASPRRSTGRARLSELDVVALDPATVVRHARRAAQIPGRHRALRGLARSRS